MNLSRLSRRVGEWAIPAFLFLALSSCELPAFLHPGAAQWLPQTKSGGADPQASGKLSGGQRLAFHRWLVTEMIEQILGRAPKDAAEVGGWANVLSQGGSIEGVYHGFVLSTEYLSLEQAGHAADIKALRFYGLEMALLDFPDATPTDDRAQKAAAKYVSEGMNLPVYSLKSILGERLLKESAARKGDVEKIAAWYAGIVVRWARLEIPFGLPQRNDKDPAFHVNWAKENTLGLLQWELLNREHRILNQLGGIAPVKAPASPAGK